MYFACLSYFFLSVFADKGQLSFQNVYHLAVVSMRVCADGAARLKHVTHNLDVAVVSHSGKESAFSTLESFDTLFLDFVKIDNHK